LPTNFSSVSYYYEWEIDVIEEIFFTDIVAESPFHSLAPFYSLLFVAVGMLLGADISISHLFFRALLPATLGNLVGGGFVIGAVYWYVFDSMETMIHFRERIRHGRKRPAIGSHSPTSTPSTSIDLDNGQSSSKRYPDAYRRFRRRTSMPVALQGGRSTVIDL
jgi:hypothetical protein